MASWANRVAAQDLSSFDARFARIGEELDVPGMAVAVVKDDKIVYRNAFGTRDPESGKPVDMDTVFYIASSTKSFTAAAILTLVDEGELSLDDPVRKHLRRFDLGKKKLTHSVTIGDLLSHGKGISNGPIVWLDAFTGQINEARFYHWLPESEVKGGFEYTNLHYTLLGRVLEAKTGKSWKDVLADRLFAPIGMDAATCYADDMYAEGQNVAYPSALDSKGLSRTEIRKINTTMHAAGGMGASANDMARWIRFQLNGGEIDGALILKPETMKKSHGLIAKGKRNILGRAREGYGLGWFVGSYQGETLVDHGGGYVGTAAAVSFMPERGIGVVVLANASTIATELITLEIYDLLLGTKGKDQLPRMARMTRQRRDRMRQESEVKGANPVDGGLSLPAEAYVGTYESRDWGTVELVLRDGKLCGRMGALPLSFGSTGTDKFMVGASTGEPDPGRFDLDGKGGVSALVLDYSDYDGVARFIRR
ncbi:MAG: serine hydrolase [Planctomycetota bacterium]